VTQQYSNSSSTPIEAVYVFPLPHDAAVYDMEIRIGNRVIRSEIRERSEAKKVYEAAKTQGKRAALVEEERPNIFTTSVANIMPGDQIDIRLRYVEPLHWESGRVRVVFPMVVGPRYIPGTQATGHDGTGWAKDTDAVPDASRITPIVRNPENRSGHDISVTVDLDPGFDVDSIHSVSHAITISPLSHGRQRIQLASQATIPNRDFVLEFQQAQTTHPTTGLFLSPAKGHRESHFVLTTYPPTVASAERVPLEMLYMIDVSGSMEGTSITQAREALLNALDRLHPTDRFAILAFNHQYQEFASEPLTATPETLAAARRYVKSLHAGGGTEMLPALINMMGKPQTPGYLRHIVLLTDGDLGNEEAIFAALQSALGDARLYTVAIGSAPNLFLATKMAQFGRGTFTQISDNSETREKMSHLFDTIENPVLTDVKLSFDGVEVADVYPKRLPDLFAGQPLVVYGQITKGAVGQVHVSARSGGQPYETTIAFDASKASFHPGITTLWARQRVDDMMDDWRHENENSQSSIRTAIIAHAIQYHLVTKFTSLIAVERRVVNDGGQSSTVPVPTEMPAGWSTEAVFGAPATGTPDAFLEALGFALLIAGAAIFYISQKKRQGALV
jgi:Ca-activated chloride channel family protein